MPTTTPHIALLLTALLAAACAEPPSDAARRADSGGDTASAPPAAMPADLPDSLRDTIRIEGTTAEIALRLYRTPDDFPLPFHAYVPGDFDPDAALEDDGAAVRFVAEFGGVRNERALVHVFVHPEDTDPQQALATVRAYQAGTGVPVSRGIEPLGEAEAARRMPWAQQAYAIRYQAGGAWYVGSIGIGARDGRPFHVLIHYPAEYGDGFGPRADLIFRTWRWADGSPLRPDGGSPDITIPSARPGGETDEGSGP